MFASKTLKRVTVILQENARRSSQAAAISDAHRDDTNKWLEVRWSDGKTGRFPYVWLKDNCPAPHSYYITPRSKTRLLKLSELSLDLEPTQIEQENSGINITWPDKKSAVYTSDWLRERNIDDKELVNRRRDVLMHTKKTWNREKFTNNLRFHDFEAVLNDDMACYDALTDIVDWGLVFFHNIKPEHGQLGRASKRLGFHAKSHYGDIFDVKYVHDPSSYAGGSTEGLELHTDHPYQATTPEVEMLHCIQNFGVGEGGESVFSDAFYAAGVIAQARPDLYNILCDVQLEYIDEGADFMPFDLVARWPVFNFDKDGYLTKVIFSNIMRSWYLDVGPEKVHKVYEAIKFFRDTVHDEKNAYKIQLEAGQMVVFDNLRVMHGRTGFQVTEDTRRHLEGMFFPWDVVKSMIRVLRDRHNLPGNHISV